MSRGEKDDASLKRLSVCASNIQSPWLWKSVRFEFAGGGGGWWLFIRQVVSNPLQPHEQQHARIQSAGVTVKMCGGQSMQSRGVVQGFGWRSPGLLLTCFIKSPKRKFLPTTTHCISDLEIKNFLHSSLAGGLTSSPGQRQRLESKWGPWPWPTASGLK